MLGVRPYYCGVFPRLHSQEEGRDHLLSRGGVPLSKPIETSRQRFLHASRTDLLACASAHYLRCLFSFDLFMPMPGTQRTRPGVVLGGLAERTARANADSCH